MKYGSPGTSADPAATRFSTISGPAIITICSLSAAAAGDAGRRALRLERDGVFDGELWRLVTGHIVHLSPGHLLLNLAGLAAIAFALLPLKAKLRWWCIVGLGAAAAIDTGLLWLQPALAWYVGLSGLLHGFWAAGSIELLAGRERAYGATLGGLLLAKLLAEHWGGAAAISIAMTGGPVVTQAHVLGALGGAVAAVVSRTAGRHRAHGPGGSL